MKELLHNTRLKIFTIYNEIVKTFELKTQQELEEFRHKADEIRNNRNYDWSERTAAEMIYTAANQKLGL